MLERKGGNQLQCGLWVKLAAYEQEVWVCLFNGYIIQILGCGNCLVSCRESYVD